MSLNPEIHCLCKKLNANKNLMQKADYFLRKLNRKGSLGSVDCLKYLICIDLAYRDLGLKWDINIANKLGLKSKQYNNTFNRIQTKLNISKHTTLSFEELTKQFRCNHIKSQFAKKYKQYQSQKISSLPIIQQKYTNLSTPSHKAALFYVVATKLGKVKVDEKKLCNVMRCELNVFRILCADIRSICFPYIMVNNNNSRKRKRFEMETKYENDEMFCDEYEKRDIRQHKEWKKKVMKENEKMRIERNGNRNNNRNKRRKIMNVNTGKQTKMFDIFAKAKKNAKKQENNNRNASIIELKDDENEDIDVKEIDNNDNKVDNVEKESENISTQNNNNSNVNIINAASVSNVNNGNIDINSNVNKNYNVNRNKQVSAKEAARRAALQRQQFMVMKPVETGSNTNDINSND